MHWWENGKFSESTSGVTSACGNEIIKLFDIPKEIINDNERQRRVYSIDGISPSVLARTDSAKILIENFQKPSME